MGNTYNNQRVDDKVAAGALRDEVGKNAHDNDGRDPDDGRGGQKEGGQPRAGGGAACSCHCVIGLGVRVAGGRAGGAWLH